ncbi:MAG TPA: response regulator transcription factor, partial [Armatimonadota bacterium]|nr:response regulator transcription factor [Armatimonadota bacterium]
MDKQHLLVVDDYDDLRELIVFALMAEGFKVTEACNGAEALEAISSLSPDLVILDIGLPDIDGIEVCKRARETTDVSILMLTGEMSADVAAQTLDAGATDYVRKPVELVELTARIRAALRGSDADEELPDTIEIGPLRLDTIREEATCGGRDLGLSGTEIRVLAYLMQNEGDVVSKD